MSTMTDDSSGQITNEKIISLFRRSSDPVLTAPEVAAEFDISTQAANYRLKQLEEEGTLKRKKVGSAAVVYWLSRS